MREWLSAQAAGGYVTYEPATGRFTLPPEHAFLLLDADVPGAFQLGVGSVRDEPKITDGFRTGAGVGWHEHDAGVYEGCERFFRPGYAMNLVSQWIPALDGVKARLEAGGRVADVGCGHGASTIIMAQAFPRSSFAGFDYHPASVEWARRAADKAGVGDRATFEVAAAKDYPGTGYDLVTFFDCLHDMGDPVGAARHVRESLAPGRGVDARGALRQRPAGGQPQPGRATLLLGVDAPLHAGVAQPGGRPRAGRPGRREAPA